MMISEGEDDGNIMITGDEECGELGQAEDEDGEDIAEGTDAGEAAQGHLVRHHLHHDQVQQHQGHQSQPR